MNKSIETTKDEDIAEIEAMRDFKNSIFYPYILRKLETLIVNNNEQLKSIDIIAKTYEAVSSQASIKTLNAFIDWMDSFSLIENS